MQGPVPPRNHRPVRAVRALDEDEEAALNARLADTRDTGLRAALERLGRAVIGADAPSAASGEVPRSPVPPDPE